MKLISQLWRFTRVVTLSWLCVLDELLIVLVFVSVGCWFEGGFWVLLGLVGIFLWNMFALDFGLLVDDFMRDGGMARGDVTTEIETHCGWLVACILSKLPSLDRELVAMPLAVVIIVGRTSPGIQSRSGLCLLAVNYVLHKPFMWLDGAFVGIHLLVIWRNEWWKESKGFITLCLGWSLMF